jgi:hypothetical protein
MVLTLLDFFLFYFFGKAPCNCLYVNASVLALICGIANLSA